MPSGGAGGGGGGGLPLSDKQSHQPGMAEEPPGFLRAPRDAIRGRARRLPVCTQGLFPLRVSATTAGPSGPPGMGRAWRGRCWALEEGVVHRPPVAGVAPHRPHAGTHGQLPRPSCCRRAEPSLAGSHFYCFIISKSDSGGRLWLPPVLCLLGVRCLECKVRVPTSRPSWRTSRGPLRGELHFCTKDNNEEGVRWTRFQ